MNDSLRELFSGGILPRLPGRVRILLTTFVVIIGVGYLFAWINIKERHGMADGKPGLSLDDIRAVFGGLKTTASGAASSRMLTMIRGEMRQYFSSDDDFTAFESWLKAGGREPGLDEGEGKRTPRKIMVRDCLRCHGQSTGTTISKDSPFGPDEFEVSYTMIARFAGGSPATASAPGEAPPQFTVPHLILYSHQHILSIPMFTLLIGLLFSMTRGPAMWRAILTPLPMLSLVFDFGGWWLARISDLGAISILVAGGVCGVAFGIQLISILVDLWRPIGGPRTP